MAGDVERESGGKRRGLPGIVGPVAAAVLADFILDQVLDPGSSGRVAFVRRVVGFAIGALLAFLLGMYLGKRSWPKRGRRLAAYLLRRAMKRSRKPKVYLTDRPDSTISLTRRIVEVVGFAAGSAVILGVALTILGVRPGLVDAAVGLFTLIALWGAFLLVPYWVFARMGLREIDHERWLVQPMSRRYADRMRLSNGALLLIAFGAIVNLAFRAGATPNDAIFLSVLRVGRVIAAVLIIAASGVVFFLRGEADLVLDLEAEAIRDGVRDARGFTETEFLPTRSRD